jgi:protoporphyrinogen oxidase
MALNDNLYDFCIVGAGPSGLTAAYRLVQAGKRVLLIERDSRVGGLAKSHHYSGHIFDTGPKRFHTDDPEVMAFINEVTASKITRIDRSTEVYFLKRYFNWPLTTGDIFKLPPGMAVKCLLDVLKKQPAQDKASFHEYIRAKYGEALYAVFFRPYTQKFLRWDSEDIHSDWASTGINRTVVDSRINANSLESLIKTLLLPEKIKTEFLYPSEGGFGGFYEQLLELCRKYPGFQLSLNDSVTAITAFPEILELKTRSGRTVNCRDFIWSGNLNDLLKIIEAQGHLHYLNTVFYNLICREDAISRRRAQWIYVSRGDSLISRITCMKEFAGYTCPKGYYNLVCELTDSQLQPKYMLDPKQHVAQVIQELKEMSFIRSQASVEAVHINPVVDTYPIYHKHYHKDFGAAAGRVRQYSKRIHLLGRCGAFWYNNSDHSIRFALEMAQRLLNKEEKSFDYRHYFGGAAIH